MDEKKCLGEKELEQINGGIDNDLPGKLIEPQVDFGEDIDISTDIATQLADANKKTIKEYKEYIINSHI